MICRTRDLRLHPDVNCIVSGGPSPRPAWGHIERRPNVDTFTPQTVRARHAQHEAPACVEELDAADRCEQVRPREISVRAARERKHAKERNAQAAPGAPTGLREKSDGRLDGGVDDEPRDHGIDAFTPAHVSEEGGASSHEHPASTLEDPLRRVQVVIS